MSLGGQQTLLALLTAIEAEVVEADARFQLLQANAWSAAGRGRPLLEGYDRLANLGLVQLSVTMALVTVRVPWWRRLCHWLFRLAPEPGFRLATDPNEPSALRVTVTFARDEQGRWRRTPSHTDGPALFDANAASGVGL